MNAKYGLVDPRNLDLRARSHINEQITKNAIRINGLEYFTDIFLLEKVFYKRTLLVARNMFIIIGLLG